MLARSSWGSGCFSKLLRLFLLLMAGGMALTAFASALAQSPGSLTNEGNHALVEGDFKTALADFRQAAKIDPSNPHIDFNIGLTLVRMGKLNDAIAPLSRAARNPSLAGEAHFLLGASYFENRQYQQAISELATLKDSPHAERSLYMLEESNRLLGHVADAREAFRQLNRKFPNSAWMHFLLATAYENQQKWDDAIKEYQKALETDSAIPNASFAIGYLYWREHNFEASRKWLQKEVAHGCHALANFYLGEITRADKDIASAERYYRGALKCDGSLADAHVRLGILLSEQKRYAEAIAQLKEAIQIDPASSSPHYHLAALYRKTGQKAEADAEYFKVRQIQAATERTPSQAAGGAAKP
jgi:tetratricopeptide (TPR) repeat protein